MRVHLTRKLAESVDGVDLSAHRAGDTFDLPNREAELLIAENWAVPAAEERNREIRRCSVGHPLTQAADTVRERIRRLAQQLENGRFESEPHRRTEDRVLDELREGREHVVPATHRTAHRADRPEAPAKKARTARGRKAHERR